MQLYYLVKARKTLLGQFLYQLIIRLGFLTMLFERIEGRSLSLLLGFLSIVRLPHGYVLFHQGA